MISATRYRDSPFEDQGNFGFSSGKGPGIDDLLNNKPSVGSAWDNEFDKTNNSSTSSTNLSNLPTSKGKEGQSCCGNTAGVRQV